MSSRLPDPGADERAHSDRLLTRLREEIAAHGPMPFSQYMERCLYAPGLGYYSAGKTKFGEAGDFITAPELGELFARCVVNATYPVVQMLGDNADFLELGGGSGAFAEAALKAFAAQGALPRRYYILEPSADLRERQRERLAAALPSELFAHVLWLDRPPEQDWQGVLFANEVIDALPTTRFAMKAGEVYEEYVALDGEGRLMRVDRPADALVSGAVRHVERDIEAEFPDGYRSEILPQLPYWIQAIAGSLTAGLMVFADYGYVRREYYLPERNDGTLRAFYRHRAHSDPLHLPGLNDLTASVDFTALAEAGNSAGFGVAGYMTQAQFLIGSGLQDIFGAAYEAATDEAMRYDLAQQVKKLTLPDQMGERFQVMLFARGMEALPLPVELLEADQGDRL
ncbi:SAM-dependent methyltransferase, MidA family [Dyella jiangningensis]|uniref:class I SAM-dependent methyltransferase n=1 Tax=Dyella sp. AtDHG13 TaxID=1938897 RepID=UPI00088EC4E7|nr:SAM-dependent methyltransferase [Dyella sp. AtDHG13]PXV59490.1 SAM-dependent MidA family methyltransferase [Dyella sp. AtDHG13]SDJ16062.1 SAM-dependent methyltransferase, MidA family [Dyella jiangningensis]